MDAINIIKSSKEIHQFFFSQLKFDYINQEIHPKNKCVNENPYQKRINYFKPVPEYNLNGKSKLLGLQECNFTVVKLATLYNELIKFVKYSIKEKLEFKKYMREIDVVMKNNLNCISSQLKSMMNQLKIVQNENAEYMVLNIELNKLNKHLNMELEESKKKIVDFEQNKKKNLQTFKMTKKILFNLKKKNQSLKKKTLQNNDKKLSAICKLVREAFNNRFNNNEVMNKELWSKLFTSGKTKSKSKAVSMDPNLQQFVKDKNLNWQKNIKKARNDIVDTKLKIKKLAGQGKWIKLGSSN